MEGAGKPVPPARDISVIGSHSNRESLYSQLAFNRWHRRMLSEHDILQQAGKIGFGLWEWCRFVCVPCRWFDSIDQERQLCVCWLKFKTFKKLVTIFLVAMFVYLVMFGVFGDEFLPGGTGFFIFVLSFASYAAGYVLMFAGLPNMFGNLLVGIILGNLPRNMLPPYNQHVLINFVTPLERIFLTLALLRAGLALDLSRIKTRVRFILRLSLIPILVEVPCTFLLSYFGLKLPWAWSAVLGAISSIASLASITTIMQNNKQNGYGEEKHLSTVLIAASAINVAVGLTLYAIFASCLYLTDAEMEKWWFIMLGLLKEALGIGLGFVFGLLVGFFPDKHSSLAPILRILILSLAAFSLTSISYKYRMTAGEVIGTLVLSVTACNIWEELGWHEFDNPVHYFFNLAFVAGQPLALVQIGFSLKFWDVEASEIGLSLAVLALGLAVRSGICFLSIMEKSYPTTWREKIFICIAWFSKGTIEILLAFEVKSLSYEKVFSSTHNTAEPYSYYIRMIKQTVLLGVLLTTPFVSYSLTLLTPKLLNKLEYPVTPSPSSHFGEGIR